jgi:NDP-sugar pyrophosphorylase family protein
LFKDKGAEAVKWVFPMAGRGTRTSKLGTFKPFIHIGHRMMLGWLLSSIASKIDSDDSLVFITTEEYALACDAENTIGKILQSEGICNSHALVATPDTPPGPSATVHSARSLLNTDEPVIVINCDQYIDFDMMDMTAGHCGFLPVYVQFGQKSSFVRIENVLVTLIVEKNNISNLASAGVYAVATGHALISAIEMQFERGQMTNGEFYVSAAVNNLIEEGYRFYPTPVRAKYDLGDVNGIRTFERTMAAACEAR